MDSFINKKTGKPIVGNVRRQVIDKMYDWGLYVYKKADGKWFTNGEGSVLNIPSEKGDLGKIAELRKVAMHHGDPGDGKAVFIPGLTRISEAEYSEQKQRLREGLIPSMNDLGAWHAAQQTVKKYGSDD